MRLIRLALLTLLTGLAAPALAEPCGTGDEIFSVQVLAIFPDQIWHDDTVGVCFKNDSGRRLNLRYTTPEGEYAYTEEVQNGQTTEKLVNMGNNVQIHAVTNVRLVNVADGQTCYQVWRWTWYPFYGYYQTICDTEYRQVLVSDLISAIRPGRLYDGPVDLSY